MYRVNIESRGECKRPGGKLVGVTVACAPDNGHVVGCRVDGDFFVEGDDAAVDRYLRRLNAALLDIVQRDITQCDTPPDDPDTVSYLERIARDEHVSVTGANVETILTALRRALSACGRDAARPGILAPRFARLRDGA